MMSFRRPIVLFLCLVSAGLVATHATRGLATVHTGGPCVGTDYSSDVLCISSLVGYWRLHDAGGSTLVDSAAGKHHATKTAGVTLGSTSLVAGSSATSAYFNGSTGYATLDAAGEAYFHNWDYNQPWMIEAMVRPSFARIGADEEYAIFSKLQSSSPFAGFEVQIMYQSSVGKARVHVFLVNSFGARHIDVIGSADVTNGVNHHIAVAYSGNGTAAGISIYVDGILNTNTVQSDTLGGFSIVNSIIPTIGARNAGAAIPFNGNIQELAIYSGVAQTTSGLSRSNVNSAGKPFYHWGLAQGRAPLATLRRPNLILDTDLASDIDDVGDVALAMGFHLRGEANLVGIVTSSANDRSADTAYAIAKYMSASTAQSLVGAWQGATPSGSPSNSRYTSDISSMFGANQGRTSYADSTAKYRALLNSQPNGSVVIVATGFFTALNALLNSAANHGGDGLGTGVSIISAKVARLVVVAGCYPTDAGCSPGNSPEFNVVNGPASDASNVAANWPVEIVAVGIELGGVPTQDILAGPTTTGGSATNPVQQAFHRWGATPRPAWGMLGVLFAVRGESSGIEAAGLRGSLTINSSTGANTWADIPGRVTWTRLSATASAFNNLFNSVYSSLPNPF